MGLQNLCRFISKLGIKGLFLTISQFDIVVDASFTSGHQAGDRALREIAK
jgi:GGDEF domain-containing protein